MVKLEGDADAKVPTIVMNTDIDATTTPMTMSKPAAGSEEAIEEGKTTEGAS